MPGWGAFLDASRAVLAVRVEAAQGYAGTLNVVGPRFDLSGSAEVGEGGVVTYTLRAENTGNRSGYLAARLTWPEGVSGLRVLEGEAWVQDGAVVWQPAAPVPVGGARFLRLGLTIPPGGAYRPTAALEPSWALGRADLPPASGSPAWHRVYLPLVLRGQ